MKIHTTTRSKLVQDITFGRIDWCCETMHSQYIRQIVQVQTTGAYLNHFSDRAVIPINFCPWCGAAITVETEER